MMQPISFQWDRCKKVTDDMWGTKSLRDLHILYRPCSIVHACSTQANELQAYKSGLTPQWSGQRPGNYRGNCKSPTVPTHTKCQRALFWMFRHWIIYLACLFNWVFREGLACTPRVSCVYRLPKMLSHYPAVESILLHFLLRSKYSRPQSYWEHFLSHIFLVQPCSQHPVPIS